MRTIVRGAVVAATTTLVMGMAGTAFADPAGPQPRDSQANSNANCVGALSSAYTHNGQARSLGQGGDPSHGTRGAELKAYLDGSSPYCP